MVNYRNGISTKNKLYNSAKKLFYENGYNGTTVSDIITYANSKLGLFTYYFDSKEAVATDIMREFLDNIMKSLINTKHVLYSSNDMLFIDMVECRTRFLSIISSKNAARYYAELSATQAFIQENIKIRDTAFKRLLGRGKYFKLGNAVLGKENPELAVSLSSGMEMQLCRDLCTKRLNTGADDALDNYFRYYYRLVTDDTELIEQKISLSREFAKKLKFSVGESFMVSIE